MMLTIEIQDDTVHSREYTNKQTGEVTTYYSQIGWIKLEEKGYPEKLRFRLKEQKGHAVGHYEVMPSSFFIGQYNDLKVGYLELRNLDDLQ